MQSIVKTGRMSRLRGETGQWGCFLRALHRAALDIGDDRYRAIVQFKIRKDATWKPLRNGPTLRDGQERDDTNKKRSAHAPTALLDIHGDRDIPIS